MRLDSQAIENPLDFTDERKPAGSEPFELLSKLTGGKALRNSPDVKTYSAGLNWKNGDQVSLRCT